MAGKKNDALIYTGAALGIAGLVGAGLYLAYAQPSPPVSPPPPNVPPPPIQANSVSLNLSPVSFLQGTSDVTVTATFYSNATPVQVSVAYIRVRDQSGTEITTKVLTTPSINITQIILTRSYPPGTYTVEISDNPGFT